MATPRINRSAAIDIYSPTIASSEREVASAPEFTPEPVSRCLLSLTQAFGDNAHAETAPDITSVSDTAKFRYAEMVREYLHDHPSISNREVRDLLGLGESPTAQVEASRYLKNGPGRPVSSPPMGTGRSVATGSKRQLSNEFSAATILSAGSAESLVSKRFADLNSDLSNRKSAMSLNESVVEVAALEWFG